MRVRNLGSKSLKEIKQKLEERGLYLKECQQELDELENFEKKVVVKNKDE
jgi:DNA-directed RNA polymerase alpha subunit